MDELLSAPTLITDIPFHPTREGVEAHLRSSRPLRVDSGLAEVLAQAEGIGKPKAMFRVAYIEEKTEDTVTVAGVVFKSRVLTVNLASAHRVFPFVATCGNELEEWSEGYTDLLQKYWADVVKEMALRAARNALAAHLREKYEPGKTNSMAPGSLPDWPIYEQKKLFTLLGDTRVVDVELNDSYLMKPIKSLSGLFFPSGENFYSCMLCPRTNCPGRRAKYDPDLFERKFRKNDEG